MEYFFCKLVPPRASFAQDMSEAERTAMMQHAMYWKGKAESGLSLTVGLVGDPQGFYGVGILEVEDEAELKDLLHNDPAILNIPGTRFEWHPMPRGVIHRPFSS